MIIQCARSSNSQPLRAITRPYEWTHSVAERASRLSEAPAPHRPGVLVVDGEGSVRTMLGLLLRLHGFAVWQAAGADEARRIRAERAEAIDLVLVNAALPGLDARGFVRSVREARPATCCCFLGGGHEFGEEDLRQMGVARFFSRPFQLTKMAKELRQVVAREQAREAEPEPALEPRPLVIDVAEPPGNERRGSVRYLCELDNSCESLGEGRSGEHWQGRILDISASGARVLLVRRFEVGTVLMLVVSSLSGDSSPHVLARVVRVAREPDGRWWNLACSFTTPLDDGVLHDLLG